MSAPAPSSEVSSMGVKRAEKFLQDIAQHPSITFVMRPDGDTIVYCVGLTPAERQTMQEMIELWRSA